MKEIVFVVALAAAVLIGTVLAGTAVAAQVIRTSLVGQIVAEDGTALPGVSVTAISETTGTSYFAVTGASGSFHLQLPPGPYLIVAELEGFSSRSTEVQVQFGQAGSVTLQMDFAVEEEVITVASGPPVADRSWRPTWNSWLEERAGRGPPLERLAVGERYDFLLDLAPVAHRLAGMISTAAGPGLVEEVRRALRAGRTRLSVQVRPVLVGRAVQLVGDRLQAEIWRQGEWLPSTDGGMVTMEIRLARLLPPEEKPPPAAGAHWRQEVDRLRAAGIRFPVAAVEEGCSAITVSIWDESGRIPLDHVVHTVAVGTADCGSESAGNEVRAGFLSLLHVHDGIDFEAALHLFELAPGVVGPSRTVAVLVPERPIAGCGHFAWDRSGTLSRYLFEQRGFRNSLRRAWRAEGDDYPGLARQLRKLLFPNRDDGGCGGWAAFEALRQMAGQPDQSLFVRLVDPFNRSHFIPLRLLFTLERELQEGESDTAGDRRIFARAPTLRQPLPVESYGDPGPCVGDWYFLLPQELHGHRPKIEPPPGLAGHPGLLRDLDDFGDLVDSWYRSDPEPDQPAVGLIVLAHHVDGALFTDDPDDPWLWTELEEARVPRGSVALLSACAAGDPTRSRELVSALSLAGFDTIILSPFDVHTPFGVDLALSFSRRVASGLHEGRAAKIADLYEAALDDTAAGLEATLSRRAHGMALEFLLAGHGTQRLCAGKTPAEPAGDGR